MGIPSWTVPFAHDLADMPYLLLSITITNPDLWCFQQC
jgi:hypothetical protein